MQGRKLSYVLSVVIVIVLIPAIVLPIIFSNRVGADPLPPVDPPDDPPIVLPNPGWMTQGHFELFNFILNNNEIDLNNIELNALLRDTMRDPLIAFLQSEHAHELLPLIREPLIEFVMAGFEDVFFLVTDELRALAIQYIETQLRDDVEVFAETLAQFLVSPEFFQMARDARNLVIFLLDTFGAEFVVPFLRDPASDLFRSLMGIDFEGAVRDVVTDNVMGLDLEQLVMDQGEMLLDLIGDLDMGDMDGSLDQMVVGGLVPMLSDIMINNPIVFLIAGAPTGPIMNNMFVPYTHGLWINDPAFATWQTNYDTWMNAWRTSYNNWWNNVNAYINTPAYVEFKLNNWEAYTSRPVYQTWLRQNAEWQLLTLQQPTRHAARPFVRPIYPTPLAGAPAGWPGAAPNIPNTNPTAPAVMGRGNGSGFYFLQLANPVARNSVDRVLFDWLCLTDIRFYSTAVRTNGFPANILNVWNVADINQIVAAHLDDVMAAGYYMGAIPPVRTILNNMDALGMAGLMGDMVVGEIAGDDPLIAAILPAIMDLMIEVIIDVLGQGKSLSDVIEIAFTEVLTNRTTFNNFLSSLASVLRDDLTSATPDLISFDDLFDLLNDLLGDLLEDMLPGINLTIDGGVRDFFEGIIIELLDNLDNLGSLNAAFDATIETILDTYIDIIVQNIPAIKNGLMDPQAIASFENLFGLVNGLLSDLLGFEIHADSRELVEAFILRFLGAIETTQSINEAWNYIILIVLNENPVYYSPYVIDRIILMFIDEVIVRLIDSDTIFDFLMEILADNAHDILDMAVDVIVPMLVANVIENDELFEQLFEILLPIMVATSDAFMEIIFQFALDNIPTLLMDDELFDMIIDVLLAELIGDVADIFDVIAMLGSFGFDVHEDVLGFYLGDLIYLDESLGLIVDLLDNIQYEIGANGHLNLFYFGVGLDEPIPFVSILGGALGIAGDALGMDIGFLFNALTASVIYYDGTITLNVTLPLDPILAELLAPITTGVAFDLSLVFHHVAA